MPSQIPRLSYFTGSGDSPIQLPSKLLQALWSKHIGLFCSVHESQLSYRKVFNVIFNVILATFSWSSLVSAVHCKIQLTSRKSI